MPSVDLIGISAKFRYAPKHYAHGCLKAPEGEGKCQGSHY
jgi:hypothetical protein